MVTRIAVSVILICIGVLLLSACGLGMLIPPRQPEVYMASLVLWDVNQGATPVQLGALRLSGPANHIDADLVFQQPDCLKDQKLYLTGSILKSGPPHLTLTQKPGQPELLQLKANLPPQPMVYSIDVTPANGSFSIDSGCAAGKTYQFQARQSPYVLGVWRGTAGPAQQGTMVETISWEQSSRFDNPQATIEFRHNPCFQKGETTAAVELPTVPQHFTLAFKMDTGATLTADTTVDVLTRNTPLITQYSVHGGACDGQSFTATLHHL
jgi:hypothetical protein